MMKNRKIILHLKHCSIFSIFEFTSFFLFSSTLKFCLDFTCFSIFSNTFLIELDELLNLPNNGIYNNSNIISKSEQEYILSIMIFFRNIIIEIK